MAKLACKWVFEGFGWYLRDASGGLHARVFWAPNRTCAPDYVPGAWVAYTEHTEGNDPFKNPEQAKKHAEHRLLTLWEELSPAFEVPRC